MGGFSFYPHQGFEFSIHQSKPPTGGYRNGAPWLATMSKFLVLLGAF